MTDQQATCPQCDADVRRADRFCESCGAALSEVRRVAIPRSGRSPDGPCTDCGNETHFDEYCTVCGHRRAEPDRDEADLGGIVLITDRGIEHARNEDAAAAGIWSATTPSDRTRSPSPCATESPPPTRHIWRRSPPRRRVWMRCSPRSPRPARHARRCWRVWRMRRRPRLRRRPIPPRRRRARIPRR